MKWTTLVLLSRQNGTQNEPTTFSRSSTQASGSFELDVSSFFEASAAVEEAAAVASLLATDS